VLFPASLAFEIQVLLWRYSCEQNDFERGDPIAIMGLK
jgi:hypothetical protein